MIKMLHDTNCCAVTEDKYKVMVDDFGQLLMVIYNKDKHANAVLSKEDAIKLTRTLMNTYEGEI